MFSVFKLYSEGSPREETIYKCFSFDVDGLILSSHKVVRPYRVY